MMMLIFSVCDHKHPSWANLVEKLTKESVSDEIWYLD